MQAAKGEGLAACLSKNGLSFIIVLATCSTAVVNPRYVPCVFFLSERINIILPPDKEPSDIL